MVVLSDREIQALLSEGHLIIEPFRPESLTPNGYDLSVGEVWVESLERTVSSGEVILPPSSRFLVSTLERVELPPDITAQLWLRSSYARVGVLASFGKVDAGFAGTLTLAAYNSSQKALSITIGGTFAQIVFEPLSSPALASYKERSGHYHDQRGVTFPRREENKGKSGIVYMP